MVVPATLLQTIGPTPPLVEALFLRCSVVRIHPRLSHCSLAFSFRHFPLLDSFYNKVARRDVLLVNVTRQTAPFIPVLHHPLLDAGPRLSNRSCVVGAAFLQLRNIRSRKSRNDGHAKQPDGQSEQPNRQSQSRNRSATIRTSDGTNPPNLQPGPSHVGASLEATRDTKAKRCIAISPIRERNLKLRTNIR